MNNKSPKRKPQMGRKMLETKNIIMEAANVNMPFQDPSIAYTQFDLPPSEEDRKRAHELNKLLRTIKPSQSNILTKDMLLKLSGKDNNGYDCDRIDISSNCFHDVVSDGLELFQKLKFIDAGNSNLVCKVTNLLNNNNFFLKLTNAYLSSVSQPLLKISCTDRIETTL